MNLGEIKKYRDKIKYAENDYYRALKTLVGKRVLISKSNQCFEADVLDFTWDGGLFIRNINSGCERKMDAIYVLEIIKTNDE